MKIQDGPGIIKIAAKILLRLLPEGADMGEIVMTDVRHVPLNALERECVYDMAHETLENGVFGAQRTRAFFEHLKAKMDDPPAEDVAESSFQVIMELLYNLDTEFLRRLAWEALLISDGPDKVPHHRTGVHPEEYAEANSNFRVTALAPIEKVKSRTIIFVAKKGWES